MPVAHPPGYLSRREPAPRLIGEECDDRIEHGNVHPLAGAAPLAYEQCGEDALRGEQPEMKSATATPRR